MRVTYALLTFGIALVALSGCARTEAFDIKVRNATAEPVTLVLTKNGPPFEPLWASPEDLAVESPDNDEQHSYAVLAPGQEADVSLKGRFDSGTRGFLRVYRGDLDLSAMAATGSTSPNRLDLRLRPGPNRFVIAEDGGRLWAGDTRARAAAP